MKFHDTELKIMEVLWREGDVPARHIAEVMGCADGLERQHHLHDAQAHDRQGGHRAARPAFSLPRAG